ncbi:exodeoxyribonuclease VII large subunit [Pontimonas sp.]|nr:exodeoxyribonuclease VII large subunit [Pontimonas sp.]
MATNDSSPEAPWPVAKLSELLGGYIERLGSVWVEGEITQWGESGGNVYGKLRDSDADASVAFTVWRRTRSEIPEGISQGDRVVAQVRPSWWVKGGTLSMNVLAMKHTGLGELLEKLAQLKETLQKEGLFAPERKQRLPLLPHTIGVVTGKDSDAEKDVITNATLRWPEVSLRVEHAAVQGERCVTEVIAALTTLDADPNVEVIIVARGGGDFQNLLPFSDERLVRFAATLTTPLVSAIGHEADRPLLDEVADLRASTPTDAAKRVVPDVAEERSRLREVRERLRTKLGSVIEYETERLAAFRSRPSLADPETLIDGPMEDVLLLLARGTDLAGRAVERRESELTQLHSSLRGLSPQGTLDRGYAIARNARGRVISRVEDVNAGDELSLIVSDGTIATHVDGS